MLGYEIKLNPVIFIILNLNTNKEKEKLGHVPFYVSPPKGEETKGKWYLLSNKNKIL